MKLLNQLCQSGVINYHWHLICYNTWYFQISIDIKTHLPLIRMLKAFIFISHFLDLHKEQGEMTKSVLSFVTNFLSISTFNFTFQKSFSEKPLPHCVMYTSCVLPWSSLVVKYQNNCLKTKKRGVFRTVAWVNFDRYFD